MKAVSPPKKIALPKDGVKAAFTPSSPRPSQTNRPALSGDAPDSRCPAIEAE